MKFITLKITCLLLCSGFVSSVAGQYNWELSKAKDGIRVNIIHPHAVFDTAAWSPEVLEQRARSYGISVEEYKAKNLLGVEVTSRDVAALALAMLGPAFAKTTGAQVPIDGGNDRVI